VVLVMAPGDGQPGLPPAAGLLSGVGVVAGESHGGRVIVQFIQLDLEFLDRMSGDGQGEGTAVAAEELVEGASEAIIIEGGDLLGFESQGGGIVASGPVGGAREGFAGEEEVFEQDDQGLRRGDARAAILGGQVVAEEVFQSQAHEQTIEDRQQSELVGVEGATGGPGGVAQWRGLGAWSWHGGVSCRCSGGQGTGRSRTSAGRGAAAGWRRFLLA